MGGTPILSMLPPPDDGPMPRRTEQWVDHHEAVLRSAPVEPPYRLVGWSYGGIVAVELARRLRDEGAEVDFVGMIDTIRPRLAPLDAREYAWYHLGAAAAMADPRQRIPYLRRRAKPLVYRRFPRATEGVSQALQRAGLRAPRKKTSEKPTDPLIVAVHTSYLNHHPVGVPFPVSLYETQESVERAMEPALRWNGWLHGGYELVDIPGGHFSLWDEEHVDALGAALACSLARSAGGAPGH